MIEDFSDDDFDELMDLLNRSDSMKYTEILVKTHLERAVMNLDEFVDSDAKKHMVSITNYVMNRHM